MAICTECNLKPSIARGVCANCYGRLKRAGKLPAKLMTTPAKDLFLRTVGHRGTECILWPYSLTSTGYGQIHWSGAPRAVHLVMCEMTHGPKPADKDEAAHRCGNPVCFNPQHIRWATYQEQADDKTIHGTKPLGRKSYNAKLTEDAVRHILHSSEPSEILAQRFGCSRQSVSNVRSGISWKHVDPHVRRQPLPAVNKPRQTPRPL